MDCLSFSNQVISLDATISKVSSLVQSCTSHASFSWMKSMPLVAEDLARAQVLIVRFKGH